MHPRLPRPNTRPRPLTERDEVLFHGVQVLGGAVQPAGGVEGGRFGKDGGVVVVDVGGC